MSAEKQAVAHGIVVALDSYLWSKRSDELAPQLRAYLEHEVGCENLDASASHRSDSSFSGPSTLRTVRTAPAVRGEWCSVSGGDGGSGGGFLVVEFELVLMC
jgi:hypothetical protein